MRTEPTYAGTQHRVIALRDAWLDSFSAKEIAVVSRVLDKLRRLTNNEVSDLSHETVAWRATFEFEEIPYGAAVLSSDAPTEEDLAWLNEMAASDGAVA